MFSAEQISYHYLSGFPVLEDISFSCGKGEIIGLLGHNGSGKTTLLKILGGLIRPVKGKVTLGDRKISDWPAKDFFSKTGLLIEDPVLYNHLSLLDNFRIFARYRGISAGRINEVLRLVEAYVYKNKKTRLLSTGMRQRAGIAAALLHDPDILLLDEPTNGLDPEGIIHVRNIMIGLKKNGKTLIVSSHLLPEMEKISDRLIILEKGRVVFNDRVSAISGYRDLEELYISIKSQRP